MGLVIESAFNTAKLGGIKMRVAGTSISYNVSSLMAHSDWSGVASVTTPTVAEDGIELFIQTYTGDANYSLSYNASTFEYTLAHTTTNFTVDFTTDGPQGYLMRSILGFSGDLSGAKTYTSDVAPWFTIEAPLDCKTNEELDYEVGDQFYGGNSNGLIWSGHPFTLDYTGAGDVVYTSSSAKRYDFRIEYIPRSVLFKHKESASLPWSWERMWLHHRTGMPFFYTDPTSGDDMAHKLRKDGMAWKPVPVHQERIDVYHLDFRTYVYR